ncbi:unnamed protein product [Camellia sinensis]
MKGSFGDKDLDLRLSNPLHLRTLLEDKRFSKLAVPKLSVHGMISSVKELLELAPIKKVMFNTDGSAFPETFYLGAKRAREVVFSVLRDACIDGDLSIPEAIEAKKKMVELVHKIIEAKTKNRGRSEVAKDIADVLLNDASEDLNDDLISDNMIDLMILGEDSSSLLPLNTFQITRSLSNN